jgi:hypothetical protein
VGLRTWLAAVLSGGLALGCAPARPPYPDDPLLIGKKPVLGKAASGEPLRVASADPVPPMLSPVLLASALPPPQTPVLADAASPPGTPRRLPLQAIPASRPTKPLPALPTSNRQSPPDRDTSGQ